MAKRRERQSFAEIVEQVRNTPPPPARTYQAAGMHPDGVMVDQDNRPYTLISDEVAPARARDLAAGGAVLAWDSCGCGGYCGFTWYDAETVARLAASGPPRVRRTKRAHGRVSEWAAENGATLLIAEGAVRWGDLLD